MNLEHVATRRCNYLCPCGQVAREFKLDRPSVHKDAVSLLSEQSWPGNVRQLENVVRRALLDARGFTISRKMIEQSINVSPAAVPGEKADGFEDHIKKRLLAARNGEAEEGAFALLNADLEEALYRQAVALSHGNQSNIAKWLGVSRMTVRDKLDKYDLFPKRP